MSAFRKETRGLMALVLAMDPTVSEPLRRMIRMGAKDIHPDYMYVRKADGTYEHTADPCAWNGTINKFLGVSLLRGRDGQWFLNGF